MYLSMVYTIRLIPYLNKNHMDFTIVTLDSLVAMIPKWMDIYGYFQRPINAKITSSYNQLEVKLVVGFWTLVELLILILPPRPVAHLIVDFSPLVVSLILVLKCSIKKNRQKKVSLPYYLAYL